jgi:DNA polymerase V
MPAVFALVDCNNFYVSCERLFRPSLNRRPVVVLSNNDGCIIARSNEAKQIGLVMGDPYFKQKALLRRHGVHVFSSNYALYGDLSNRVMTVLQQIEPDVEVYSIDEAFVKMPVQAESSAVEQGREIKEKVDRYVGVPVSVGLGKTKTLAKLAATIAKKDVAHKGVFCLDDIRQDEILATIVVNKIWGVGRRSTVTLNRHGIYTALDLKQSDSRKIRRLLGLSCVRTVMELRGQSSIPLEETPPSRKSVVSSRSFRTPVTELADLKEAVSCYISIAANKLRKQGLVAANVHVFLSTSRFRTDIPYFSGSKTVTLLQPTSVTPLLLKAALRELVSLYRPGYPYNKAGIMLTGLGRETMQQQNLFLPPDTGRNPKLMAALDQINDRWGRDTLRYGSSGLERGWSMKQTRKSPAYTTRWTELPVVR